MKSGRFYSFVIFGAVRTGSNFLERTLAQHPHIATFGELFNPDFFGERGTDTGLGFTMAQREAEPLRVLREMRHSTADLPGFRLFERHDTRVADAVLDDPHVAKIILRRPLIDSYLSLMIARATDQWILGDAKGRKTAKIKFDPADYEPYRDAQESYYATLTRRLQTSGQTAFQIDFEQLSDLDVLNGLLRFLGVEGDLETPDKSLKPQNPGSRADKVTNPKALAAFVKDERAAGTPRGPQLRRMITSTRYPLLFAPVAGVNAAPIAAWMESDGERHSQATLKAWQDTRPGFTSFSVIAHPLARAFFTFQRRIVAEGPDSYPKIRNRLVKFHNLVVPEGDAVPDWQAGFLAFLQFLERNLAGQTGIRIDDDWALQSNLVAAINAQQPIMRVLRESELESGLAELCPQNSTMLAMPTLSGPPLDAVLTPEIERLARKIYRVDYRRFGFGDFGSGSL